MSASIKDIIKVTKKHKQKVELTNLKNKFFKDSMIAGHLVPISLAVITNENYVLLVETTNIKSPKKEVDNDFLHIFSSQNIEDINVDRMVIRNINHQLLEILSVIMKRSEMKRGDTISLSFHKLEDIYVVSGLSQKWQRYGVNRFYLLFYNK